MTDLIDLTDRLAAGEELSDDEWRFLIEGDYEKQLLFYRADEVRRQYYGTDVYIRGLIEISNYCRNDCLYCGIRRSNANVLRYRLAEEEILACCKQGYELGFRTFVLQGGEDAHHTTAWVEEIVFHIKEKYPDCAVTLSLGSVRARIMKSGIRRELTGIYYGMRRRPALITGNCIRRNRPICGAWSACGICGKSAIRPGRALWSVLPFRGRKS